MSDEEVVGEPLRDAAALLRSGEINMLDDEETLLAVADLLDAEAVVRSEMRPFAELLNAMIEQASGVESYIRFGSNEDGSMAMWADTSPACLRLADLILTSRSHGGG